ncbi:MAG: hypothetical protein O2782_22940 [bacterium]|nr:hypothetical protein [bacterium]
MPSASRGFLPRGIVLLRSAGAILVVASCVSASPVRVATLGGDSHLLLDSSNLYHYPALVRQLAHVNVELYDDWVGVAIPIGRRHGVALMLNRPDEVQELSAYLRTTGSRLLRSLNPEPWLDAIYGLQLRPGLSLGLGLRYDYDVRDQGLDEASVSRWDGRFGVALGSGRRRLDGALQLQRVTLGDGSAGIPHGESADNGYGVDLRGRWLLSEDVILLPSFLWRRSTFGLARESRREEELRGAISLNARPAPNVLMIVGVVVAGHWQRSDVDGDGLTASESRRWLLPGIVAGGEVQLGSLQFRLGARHESVVDELDEPTGVDLSFATGLATDVGIGVEIGDFVIDGMLQKDFLRDGPHFLGGSPRGGGLLTTLSILYRFYR